MDKKNGLSPRTDLMIGVVLFAVGLVMLLTHIDATSIGFWMWGTVNSAPVIIVLIAVFICIAVMIRKKWPWFFVLGGMVLLVVSVLLGTRFSFSRMNALTLILMFGTFAAGIGFLLSYVIRRDKE